MHECLQVLENAKTYLALSLSLSVCVCASYCCRVVYCIYFIAIQRAQMAGQSVCYAMPPTKMQLNYPWIECTHECDLA
jgi:hypothetical protein